MLLYTRSTAEVTLSIQSGTQASGDIREAHFRVSDWLVTSRRVISWDHQ